MLTDQELMRVQAVTDKMSEDVTIMIGTAGTGSVFENNLANIARQISGVSMNRVRVEEWHERILPGKPVLSLTDGQTTNIHYVAAPEGTELAPFLEALSWLGKGEEVPASDVVDSLQELKSPVDILVLMAESCPHCPQAVSAALSLAVGHPMITVNIVDALQIADVAERYKVKSTPTIVINDGMTIVGRITRDELARRVAEAGKEESLTSVLDSMIRTGRAEDAAELMCRENRPAAVLPIYLSKEFSVRMGALLAMEEALERNPRIMDPVLGQLTDLLFQEEVALRGDTAGLLGKIGNPEAVAALRKVKEDPDPDVREAVLE
ncbi:MAG: thioredoxin family protein, partial [Pseudomonadota bacterium]